MQSAFFKQVVALKYGEKYARATNTVIQNEIFTPLMTKLIKKWADSNFTDFSVYTDDEYFADLLSGYLHVSAGSIKGMFLFLTKSGIDFSKYTFFDDYNGLGLTTVDIIEKVPAKQVFFCNPVAEQCKYIEDVCKLCNVEMPIHDVNRTGKYDVVLSLEIAEHQEHPLEYIKQILSMVKEGGYFVYASGFDSLYVGHLPYFDIEGHQYAIRDAGHFIRDWLLKEYDLLYVGWNGKPRIYKKRLQGAPVIDVSKIKKVWSIDEIKIKLEKLRSRADSEKTTRLIKVYEKKLADAEKAAK